jgi:hypothetical protein
MESDTRRLDLIESASIPRDGMLLGWAAMAPFPLLAAALWAVEGSAADMVAQGARLWGGALILFFSGVRRGLSFRTENGPTWRQLVVFALLFFGGLVVLILPAKTALLLVAVAFATLGVEDRRAARRGEVPLYFSRLRPPQMTSAAAFALLCGWAA